ncbi:MAG: hypothetical protein CMQ38_11390 [Gammaproteobacteria bacterium]|nr:hypothetical protein [Gammaproteobacteria bacterium]
MYLRIKMQVGFSLVEMAMVLMILGILLSGVLVAVGDSTDSVRISSTRSQLRQIEEALYGYAQATGYLPCPATGLSNGLASYTSGTSGACTNYHGFIPAATLNIYGSINEDGLLLDAWQNPIRYSVSALDVGVANYFTDPDDLKTLFGNVPGLLDTYADDADMLRVCQDMTDCAGTTIADTVPAVIISMGENWPDLSGTSSAEEQENAFGATLTGATTGSTYNISNTNSFVDTTYNETEYDDQIRWLSPHILFSRLIQAGQLP